MHEIVDSLENKVYEELSISLSLHMDPSYCLEDDHFQPVPCRIDSKNEQKKILEKNTKARNNGN